MEDRDKDKEQFQNKLTELHKKIDELEHVKANHKYQNLKNYIKLYLKICQLSVTRRCSR